MHTTSALVKTVTPRRTRVPAARSARRRLYNGTGVEPITTSTRMPRRAASIGRSVSAGIAGNDHQIHSLAHRVDTERGDPCTTIGPLSALRKASICRNSTAFNRSGFNSVCPAGAAGARL